MFPEAPLNASEPERTLSVTIVTTDSAAESDAGSATRRHRMTEVATGHDTSGGVCPLGVSLDFFSEHIQHELRLVRRGRKVLIATRELEDWLARNGSLKLEPQ